MIVYLSRYKLPPPSAAAARCTAYDARTGSPINRELNIHRDVAALAAQARRAERQ